MAQRPPSSSQMSQTTTTAKCLRPCSSEDGGAADRISALPDGVLQNILSFLPISAAGRTSLLSRRWRLLWTALPSLNLLQHHLPKPSSDSDSSYRRFVFSMLCALLRRSSAAAVRSLRFLADHPHTADDDAGSGGGSSSSYPPCCAADEIAAFALRRGAQELSLDFLMRFENARAESTSCLDEEIKYCYYDYKSLHALPLSLLKLSPSLRVVRLKDCRLRVPSTAAAAGSLLAPQLEILWLTRVYPAKGGDGRIVPLLHRLIAGCPRLKSLGLDGYPAKRSPNGSEVLTLTCRQLTRLTLKCCHCFRAMKIDAPRLESLEFLGDVPPRFQFVLAGSPGLARADITFCRNQSAYTLEERNKFLQKFSHVQFLRFHCSHLPEIVAPRETGCELRAIYHRLKRLELHDIFLPHYGERDAIVKVVSLLAEMPVLEHLTLGFNNVDWPTFRIKDTKQFWDKEHEIPKLKGVSVNSLQHNLKTMKIIEFYESEIAIPLVKYLLRNAFVLEEMVVRSAPPLHSDHLRIQQELLKLRANSSTKITMI